MHIFGRTGVKFGESHKRYFSIHDFKYRIPSVHNANYASQMGAESHLTRITAQAMINERGRKEKRMPAPPESALSTTKGLCAIGNKQYRAQSHNLGTKRARRTAMQHYAVTGRLSQNSTTHEAYRGCLAPSRALGKETARVTSCHNASSRHIITRAVFHHKCRERRDAKHGSIKAALPGCHRQPRHVLGVQPLPPSRKG